MPSDNKRWFNLPTYAETLLRIHYGPGETSNSSSSSQSPTSNRDCAATQQHVKTYHTHALILRGQSAYFDASLGEVWQQLEQHTKKFKEEQRRQQQLKHQQEQGATPSSAPGASVTLDLHLDPGQEDAMDLLLRYLYDYPLPAVTPDTTALLFQCLHLADRFDVPQCVSAILSTLKGTAVSAALVQHVIDVPPGITGRPDYKTLLCDVKEAARKVLSQPTKCNASYPDLLDACNRFIVHVYGDVPAVIRSEKLREEFRSLPFAAVLAWAESDELQVHNENCVVYLLSTWVWSAQRVGGQGVSAEQLEQLARQVRVLRLGPAYQHHILPQLGWFKGCKCSVHLPTLLAFKGKDASGKAVFPAAGLYLVAHISKDLPQQWVAKARQRVRVTDADQRLRWTIGGGNQLQQLHQGKPVFSSPLYFNGFMLRMEAQCRITDDGTKSLGLYVGVDPVQAHGAISWPDTATVAIGRVGTKVLHGPTGWVGRTSPPFLQKGSVGLRLH